MILTQCKDNKTRPPTVLWQITAPDQYSDAHILTGLVNTRPGVLNDASLHICQRLWSLPPLCLFILPLFLHATDAPRGTCAWSRHRRWNERWWWWRGPTKLAEGATETQGKRVESVHPPPSHPVPLTPLSRQDDFTTDNRSMNISAVTVFCLSVCFSVPCLPSC